MFSIMHKILLPVFGVEALLCIFLCLPLPGFVVKRIANSARSPPNATFGTIYYTILAVIFILFLNAVYEATSTTAVAVGLADGTMCTDSQAVAYLSGFTLLLTRVSKKLFDLTGEHFVAKIKEDAMAKQAKGAAEFAAQMMKEGGKISSEKPKSAEAEKALEKQKENQAAEYAKQMGDNEFLKSLVEKKDANIKELRQQLEDLKAMMGTSDSAKKSS